MKRKVVTVKVSVKKAPPKRRQVRAPSGTEYPMGGFGAGKLRDRGKKR